MATHPKISKAKARLLMDHPFFATLLLRTPVMVTDETPYGQPIPLAATDGEQIYYNPEFLEKCSVEDVMTVLAHEIGHDSLLHSFRLGGRNADLFNQAADHAINLMLIDQKFQCPNVLNGGWLADPQYKGMSADKIYDDLKRKQQPPSGGGQGGGQGNGKGKGKGGAPGQPGQGNSPGSGSGKPQQRDGLHGDLMPARAKSDADQAAAQQRAKQRVASAANMARLAGKLTGELERMVGDMLETKVSWVEVLREYMLRIVKTKDNWTRRNRRFSDIYLPTRRSRKMGPMVFIPDTSGSMMGDDMEKICSEMSHCAQQVEPEGIRVIWADAAVKGEQDFANNEFSYAALKPEGGGGTDMRVPLKYAEQYDPVVVVLMTDCYTPWPDEPCPFPVICISTTKQSCPDWMERIEI